MSGFRLQFRLITSYRHEAIYAGLDQILNESENALLEAVASAADSLRSEVRITRNQARELELGTSAILQPRQQYQLLHRQRHDGRARTACRYLACPVFSFFRV